MPQYKKAPKGAFCIVLFTSNLLLPTMSLLLGLLNDVTEVYKAM